MSDYIDPEVVDALAADIREIDGGHSMGATALAELLVAKGWVQREEFDRADSGSWGQLPEAVSKEIARQSAILAKDLEAKLWADLRQKMNSNESPVTNERLANPSKTNGRGL